MDVDSIYINFWGKTKPKFTDMELALMEGGHSLEEFHAKNQDIQSPSKWAFIRSLPTSEVNNKK